jgi:nucleoside-diphosphate-sugar epimerase
VSSGCIYTGYTKNFTETDIPNFGIYNPDSSFYSKTKHICEINLANFNTITLRIRMPFNSKAVPKNLIYKIFKYDNIINYPNSGTNTDNLNEFIHNLIVTRALERITGPLNVVNPGVVTGKKIADLLDKHGLANPNWKIVDIKDLDIKAQRSNCILDERRAASEALLMPHVDDILEDTIKSFVAGYRA